MPTIRAQLLLGLLAGISVSILLALAGTYTIARLQAGHAFDFHLQQIAETTPDDVHAGVSERELDAEEFILLQIWDKADGKVDYTSRANMLVPRQSKPGFQDVHALGKDWRVFVQERDDHIIQVSQLMDERNELTLQLALSAVLPVVALIPLLALLVGVVVNRGLKPLQHFADAVGERTPEKLQPIALPRAPREILPVMHAINTLIVQLEQALHAQKEFIADAAHELRTPLAALRLQMQLAEHADGDTARAQAFAKLHLRLDRAEHLVAQLLDMARQDVTNAKAQKAHVDLVAVAKKIVAEFSLAAEARQIDLGLDSYVENLVVDGVRADLEVMLRCLVDNAVRYSLSPGRVDVRLERRDGKPMLAVIDNGPGIPAAERERVFDRFYRGEGATAIGSGLGLAIAQKIAQAHGATLGIEDNDDGRGILVAVVFP